MEGISAELPSMSSHQQMSTTAKHLPITESGSIDKEKDTIYSSHGTCILFWSDAIKRLRKTLALFHMEIKEMTGVVAYICNPSTSVIPWMVEAGGSPQI